jgi:hypothetical protein
MLNVTRAGGKHGTGGKRLLSKLGLKIAVFSDNEIMRHRASACQYKFWIYRHNFRWISLGEPQLLS